MAKRLWGAPKPRKAPGGGVLVATARAWMRTCGGTVDTRRMEGAAAQHHGGHGGVGAAVQHEVHVDGQELAVPIEGHLHVGPGGVPLGGAGQVLLAVVDDLHGLAGLPGQQGGMAGNDGGIVLLAAEGAAHLQGDDAHLVVGQAEELLHGAVHVVGALQGALDHHLELRAFAFHVGEHGVGLQVHLLLGAGAVGPFDHVGGLGPDGVGVALADPDLLEEVVGAVDDLLQIQGGLDVQDRRQLLHLQGHGPAGLLQQELVRGGPAGPRAVRSG